MDGGGVAGRGGDKLDAGDGRWLLQEAVGLGTGGTEI